MHTMSLGQSLSAYAEHRLEHHWGAAEAMTPEPGAQGWTGEVEIETF